MVVAAMAAARATAAMAAAAWLAATARQQCLRQPPSRGRPGSAFSSRQADGFRRDVDVFAGLQNLQNWSSHQQRPKKTRRCCENRDASAVSHRRRRACARRHDADASHVCTRRPQRLHAVWRPVHLRRLHDRLHLPGQVRRVPERRDFGAVVQLFAWRLRRQDARRLPVRPQLPGLAERVLQGPPDRGAVVALQRQRPTASRRGVPCRRATTTHRCTSLASRCRRRCACGSPPTRPLPPTTRCGPRGWPRASASPPPATKLELKLSEPAYLVLKLGASSRRCSSLPTRRRRRRRPVPA